MFFLCLSLALLSGVAEVNSGPVLTITQPPISQAPITQAPAVEFSKVEFSTFPVGLIVNERTVVFAVLVRGAEDGLQAIELPQWQIPFDAVMEALKIKVTPLDGERLELRSPFLITEIDSQQLTDDPDLGLALSVAQIEQIFGIPVEFNINEYALTFSQTQADRSRYQNANELLINLEGLPLIAAPTATLTAVEQRTNIAGSVDNAPNYRGDFNALGSVWDGVWSVQINQSDLAEPNRWRLAEGQYVRQTDRLDYAIGTQRPFWLSNSGEYWGLTTVYRQGFVPPFALSSGGFNARQRLQSNTVERSITGFAEPGTLVRLTQGLSALIIDEVVVDGSGTYQFEAVGTSNRQGNFRLLLYPQGRLSATPEIRDVILAPIGGQLSAGDSAAILSIGVGREFASSTRQGEPDFWGKFTDVRAGGTYRYGISENFTLGAGVVYDQVSRSLGEFFVKPTNVPLEITGTIFSPDQAGTWDLDGTVLYRPRHNFTTFFNTNRSSRQVNVNWTLSRHFTLVGTYDNQRGAFGGLQFSHSQLNRLTSARLFWDQERALGWNLRQRWQDGFSDQSFNQGHFANLNYETQSQNPSNNLLGLGWSFRSEAQVSDGRSLWEFGVGYGIGSEGSGPIATLQTSFFPGLFVRGQYRGISISSNRENYQLEVLANFNLQDGIFGGDSRSRRLRSQGGLMIQPFLDMNSNGEREQNEPYHTDDAELLLILNTKLLKTFRPTIQGDRILVQLQPGSYRLDLDPAGYPLDWQAEIESYGVEVIPGSFTPVKIPLIAAYTLAGVVTDDLGNGVGGTRVEAINLATQQRVFSVTNGAGVYFLERLQQGTYELRVQGELAQPSQIQFDRSTERFQELNLQIQ
jgi:hypothetical protein